MKLWGLIFLLLIAGCMNNNVESYEKVVITLPYAPEDPPREIMPMGETINHPEPENPGGHPGIDFIWHEKKVRLISSVDGQVETVEEGSKALDVYINSGPYQVRYTHLDEVAPDIKAGANVKKGDFIGYPMEFDYGDGTSYSFHWELAYTNRGLGRICPLTYFDEESRSRIEEDWTRVSEKLDSEMKENAPYLCSRYYFGKDR